MAEHFQKTYTTKTTEHVGNRAHVHHKR